MAKDDAGRGAISGKIDLLTDVKALRGRRAPVPFNGQDGRWELFGQIMAAHRFAAIVETGTNRGWTTRAMAEESGLPVFSIEVLRQNYKIAQSYLSDCADIHLFLGDSATVLPGKVAQGEIPDRNVFCYLDAHWQEELPLADEIEAVTSAMTDFVIMIDDFQVPDDPGYHFDAYGPGKVLCLDYLRPFVDRGLFVFLPSRPSAEETGARRGCVVLTASVNIAIALRKAPALRDVGLLHWLLAPPSAG